jgi:membrane protease YdiL (CAAX protease family)
MVPAVGISAVLTRLFYGSSGQPPQVEVARRLPRVASVYSVLVWPVIWSASEEATYLGYTLPRLEALTGNTAVSAVVVSGVWALQHEALPLLPDGRYQVYRALSALPVTFTTTLLYLLRGRRLPPLIVAHWASDAASAVFAALPQRQMD